MGIGQFIIFLLGAVLLFGLSKTNVRALCRNIRITQLCEKHNCALRPVERDAIRAELEEKGYLRYVETYPKLAKTGGFVSALRLTEKAEREAWRS